MCVAALCATPARTSALVLPPRGQAGAFRERCACAGNNPVVFRHICEAPRLHEIIVPMAVRSPTLKKATGQRIACVPGGYRFTEACIYLELYATLSPELWVLDGALEPWQYEARAPLLRLVLDPDELVVTAANGSVNRYPSGQQELMAIEIGGGRVRLAEVGTSEREESGPAPQYAFDLDAPQGVYLALPGGDSWCQDCSLFALEIYLPSAAAERWVVDVAEVFVTTHPRSPVTAVSDGEDGEDWEAVAGRLYLSERLMLVAAAANATAGPAPRTGFELAAPPPRQVVPDERLLLAQCAALDQLARLRWAWPEDAEDIASHKFKAGELREIESILREASRLLREGGEGAQRVPLLAVAQLDGAAAVAGKLDDAPTGGYAEDVVLIQRHLARARAHLIDWAQAGFP